VDPRCIQIERVVRQAVTMLSAIATEKRVGLEAGVDTRIPLVSADPDRLQQMLINLIDNAIKFTPPDGSVIRPRRHKRTPGRHPSTRLFTGRGISPEARALVFERLYQDPNAIDNSRKGLGLGLYITKELVRLQGGRIWVESQVGHGSVFTFTLPLFSLPKLLFPTITDQGHLRSAVSLITVEMAPLPACSSDQWQDARRQCLQLLKASVYRGEDLVLPAPESTGQQETFLIVAAADELGARATEKRIGEQIERHRELHATCRIKVTHAPLQLPDATSEGNLEAQVQQVADRISELAMPAFGHGPSSQNAMEENPGLAHRPETTKERTQ
jgi:Histidine kinase-, DNA gyrase B-, and HSP90-like ATPase